MFVFRPQENEKDKVNHESPLFYWACSCPAVPVSTLFLTPQVTLYMVYFQLLCSRNGSSVLRGLTPWSIFNYCPRNGSSVLRGLTPLPGLHDAQFDAALPPEHHQRLLHQHREKNPRHGESVKGLTGSLGEPASTERGVRRADGWVRNVLRSPDTEKTDRFRFPSRLCPTRTRALSCRRMMFLRLAASCDVESLLFIALQRRSPGNLNCAAPSLRFSAT